MSRPNWFIGLTVPAASWVAALAPVPRGARAFHPADVHVTVAFLGPVGEARARRAWATVEATPLGGPLTFAPGPIRPFGHRRRPSAFSVVPAGGAAPLVDLIARLRDPALEAAEARPDTRPPKPHATLARPLRRATDAEREALAAWAERQALPEAPVTIEEIALYTWSEARRERLFRVVASRRL